MPQRLWDGPTEADFHNWCRSMFFEGSFTACKVHPGSGGLRWDLTWVGKQSPIIVPNKLKGHVIIIEMENTYRNNPIVNYDQMGQKIMATGTYTEGGRIVLAWSPEFRERNYYGVMRDEQDI